MAGNSLFKDDVVVSTQLKEKGIHYVDVGTSGGVWVWTRLLHDDRRTERSCAAHSIRFSKRLLQVVVISLALPAAKSCPEPPRMATSTAALRRGTLRENGSQRIEYGLMQAYAEGFWTSSVTPPARKCRKSIATDLNLPDIAEVWRRGSVVSSWLLD